MAAGGRKLVKDEYLFKEGDPSDAMYVLKSGRLAVTKSKQNAEIVLAEITPGSMVGEMAFFDNKPRSASVKAMQQSEVIALPFNALHKQFATFPEWCKAIMRTVNDHLRDANKRIKSLESVATDSEVFPPHMINKLLAVLNLVSAQFGDPGESGQPLIHSSVLRTYTIQIFQLPTHKMDKLLETLAELELVMLEDTGDGYKRIKVLEPKLLFDFVEWHNNWLFKAESERITLPEDELPALKGFIHFASKSEKSPDGKVKLSLNFIQNESMKELGYLVKKEDAHRFIAKEWMDEIIMEDDQLWTSFHYEDIQKMIPFWELLYKLKKYSRG